MTHMNKIIKIAPPGCVIRNEENSYITLNCMHGRQGGGEMEISIPISLWERFTTDEQWRNTMFNKYARTLFYGAYPGHIPVPETEQNKSGVIPENES